MTEKDNTAFDDVHVDTKERTVEITQWQCNIIKIDVNCLSALIKVLQMKEEELKKRGVI